MEKRNQPKGLLWAVIVAVAVVALAVVGLLFIGKSKPVKPEKKLRDVPIQPKTEAVIDYKNLKKDDQLQAMMKERKEKYGVGEGVDIIAKADETLRIGDNTVSMEEIQEKIRLKTGDIVEVDLKTGKPGTSATSSEEFGIYVVRAGDNIWNIHFRFLKDYFDRKGIAISPLSDEPNKKGFSSGVGKLLKFSENIVYIYNIREKKLDVDLNMIQPLNKLVVYKMTRVFSLLDGIDYKNVNRIQFDGDTIWLPGE